MIDNFFKNGRSSYAEGLASLYTYERQIPEIAETKIRGLKNHYGVTSKEGLEFFEVHKAADVYHREACEKLLDDLSPEEQKKQKFQLYQQLSICGTFCQVLLKSTTYRDRLLLNQIGILIYKVVNGSLEPFTINYRKESFF